MVVSGSVFFFWGGVGGHRFFREKKSQPSKVSRISMGRFKQKVVEKGVVAFVTIF